MIESLIPDNGPLSILFLSTAWLIVGLVVSSLLARQQAKAHVVLVAALIGLMVTPVAQCTVAYFGCGLVRCTASSPPVSASAEKGTQVAVDFNQPDSTLLNRAITDPPAVGPGGVDPSSAAIQRAPDSGANVSLRVAVTPFSRRNLLILFTVAWGLTSSYLIIRVIVASIAARSLVAQGRPVYHTELSDCLQSAANSLQIKDCCKIAAAPIHSPIVWCWGAAPLVLVPFDATFNGTDWIGIFRHELAHWKRKDHITGLLALIAVVLLPWNPFTWLVKRRMHELSEQVCDQWAVVDGRSPLDYADSLLNLRPESRHSMALAAVTSRSLLIARIDRLLRMQEVYPHVGRRWATACTGLTVACTIALAFAQAAPAESTGTATSQATDPAASEDNQMIITGLVKREDNQPARNAEIAVIGEFRRVARGGDFAADEPEVIVRGTTDQTGRFELKAPGETSQQVYRLFVLAHLPQHALGWQSLEVNHQRPTAEIALQKEKPVRGRLIDISGQPAVGVALRVGWLGKSVNGRHPGIRFNEKQNSLSFWPSVAKTDDQGSFVLSGVNREQGVVLFTDDPRYARTMVTIRAAENLENDHSEEPVFSLAPSQIVEGIVTAADTGKPIPHARITVFASPNNSGAGNGIAGVTDDQGRFEMNPYAAPFYGVNVFAPDGQPYLAVRKVNEWPKGSVRQTFNISLPRGVLVRGQLSEADNGRPVAGAGMQYVPRSKNPHVTESLLTGWQNMSVSGPDGVFQMAVPPGEGSILVKGPHGDFIHQDVSELMIRDGQPGGRRSHPDALIPLNLAVGTAAHDVKAQLRRGVTLRGQLFGPEGQPVNQAVAIYASYLPGSDFEWRFPEQIGGRFELHGCDPDADFRVMFLDPEHHWGASLTIPRNSQQSEPLTVRLQPCGTASARMQTKSGQPWKEARIVPDLIVTPGRNRYDNQISNRNQLVEDSIINANVDRLNYWKGPLSNDDGRITYPALIPGATYRMVIRKTWVTAGGKETNEFKEWVAKSGENIELGDLKYEDID